MSLPASQLGSRKFARPSNPKFRAFRRLKADSDKALADFFENLPNVIKGDEQWVFKSKEDATLKVNEVIKAANKAFSEILDRLLDDKKSQLDLIASEIQQDTDEKIFKQLSLTDRG